MPASAVAATPVAATAALLAGPRLDTVLAAAWPHSAARVQVRRRRAVHQRGERSVSHVVEARLGDGRDALLVVHADARGYPAGARVVPVDGHEVAVWRFPDDPYLPDLGAATDVARVRGWLDRLGRPSGTPRLRTRTYRPARRAVVEVALPVDGVWQPQLYLKVTSRRRARRLVGHHRHLAAHLPVAPLVDLPVGPATVALGALPGRTLRDALVSGAPVPDPGTLVACSQRLAASGLSSSASPRAFAAPDRHVALLRHLLPDTADLLARVGREAARVEGPPAVVHGDLHGGQLLVDGCDLTGLLDVDGAGTGLLAHDAGSLVASLRVLGELHPEAHDTVEAYAAAVADAYRPLVGAASLARATAGAWLALATGPHRAQSPDGVATTRTRIRRAIDALP